VRSSDAHGETYLEKLSLVSHSLHEKGYISDPATKNKSVWLSEKGAKLSEELFEKHFAVK
jgi:hypothetical protein